MPSQADRPKKDTPLLTVQLLGKPQAQLDTQSISFKSDKRYQLLSYLAYKNDWVNRDEAAHLFWSDVSTHTARHSLRQLLKRIRSLNWLSNFETESTRIRWQVKSDSTTLINALHENKQNLISLYQGPLLKGLEPNEANEFSHWLLHERQQLYAQYRKKLLSYAEQENNLDIYKILLKHDPLDEDVMRTLLKKALQLDAKQDALNCYRNFSRQLQHELELLPSSETEHLAEQVKQSDTVASQKYALPERPKATSSFIGRDLELGEIAHLLNQTDCRLLSLVGIGGIGKSRIALKTAQELAKQYTNGAVFIELETLTKTNALTSSVANDLNLKFSPKISIFEQLSGHLKTKNILVILDNFEQLLKGATLLADLLSACPKLKLLITSRERLNLQEEWLLPIEGLSYPNKTDLNTLNLADIEAFDALKLFMQRAVLQW